ncbi:hypothetical protein [Roseateles amylovorans]|uniref:Lipoprotein n=1 Tax=Roseateles amylovorans TaxID=2978473 RepID=A0ABY6B851_9BURK|nr:hypothetical protein [Roseateles amylovorans]UXH80121.1 hypothetical protein N4261_09660 [Roseateles amylovorans]
MQKSLIIFLSLPLSACSVFTPPIEKPVIEDRIQSGYFGPVSIGILSLTPERRTVLYNFKTRRFCAENPTEVGIDLASARKAVAALKVAEKGEAEVGIALAMASNNQVLNRRTQGLQLYQASSFTLCQMYLNEAISPEEFLKTQLVILASAGALISQELAREESKTTAVSGPARAATSPADAAKDLLTRVDSVTVRPAAPPASAASEAN